MRTATAKLLARLAVRLLQRSTGSTGYWVVLNTHRRPGPGSHILPFITWADTQPTTAVAFPNRQTIPEALGTPAPATIAHLAGWPTETLSDY